MVESGLDGSSLTLHVFVCSRTAYAIFVSSIVISITLVAWFPIRTVRSRGPAQGE